MRQEMIHWKREKTLQNVTLCDSRRPREGTKSLICKLALLVGMPSCYNKITPWIQYATQLSSLYSTIIYQEISMSWQIIWHCIGAGNWSFKLLPTRNFKVQEKKKSIVLATAVNYTLQSMIDKKEECWWAITTPGKRTTKGLEMTPKLWHTCTQQKIKASS